MAAIFFVAFLHFGCSDFFHPVDSTPTPSEYEYNYWLLQKTFLFEDILPQLDPQGDSVQALYSTVQKRDRFTRYVPPSKSEAAAISMNTSIVQGDVGMEYYLDSSAATLNSNGDHPLFIYRVYRKSPAGEAGVPRYGNIINVNEIELVRTSADPTGYSVYTTYDSVLTYSKKISLTVVTRDSLKDTLKFELEKTDVYAPTIFVDTVSGVTIVSITEFKQQTVDQERGTYGELKDYLDSTQKETGVRILNLLNNPGGHVNQCISMADLFVSSGPLSTRSWRTFKSNGEAIKESRTAYATVGDAGENHQFLLLVNGGSASCAEIFAAAVSEGANIPVIGDTTYGKGIGQTTWQTLEGGIAVITNLEFLTPKGNSYHTKGIVPDYVCTGNATVSCGVSGVKNIFSNEAKLKIQASKPSDITPLKRGAASWGGAFIED